MSIHILCSRKSVRQFSKFKPNDAIVPALQDHVNRSATAQETPDSRAVHHPLRPIDERHRVRRRRADALLDIAYRARDAPLDRRVRLRLPLLQRLRDPVRLVLGVEAVEEPEDVRAPERGDGVDAELAVGQRLGRVSFRFGAVARLLDEPGRVDFVAMGDGGL